MSVRLGPGVSIVFRKASLERASVAMDTLCAIGGLLGEDDGIAVFGPFYSLDSELSEKLAEMGLVYFKDFFEAPDSGGPTADWCGVSLFSRETVEL